MNSPFDRCQTLLMLAHRMPDPQGDLAQCRAWAWLEASRRSSVSVWLIVMADRRINLSQWQDLQPMAARLHLASPGEVRDQSARWAEEQSFAACLCTSASLWPRMATLSAGYRMVDVGALAPGRYPRLTRWRSGWRLAQQAGAGCDRLMCCPDVAQVALPDALPIATHDTPAMQRVLLDAMHRENAPLHAFTTLPLPHRQAA